MFTSRRFADLQKLRQFWFYVPVKLGLSALLLYFAVHSLNHRIGPAPAIGPFLSPFTGIWRHAPSLFESPSSERELELKMPGLQAPVKIVIDRDQIKHIFAENDEDLYFAQGWTVASERLWQMEFVTRLAAGRISEVLGRAGLSYDQRFLKMGLAEAAKVSAELMLQDSVTAEALKSYSRGVNHYIQSLSEQDLPFEYRLLGVRPELWSPGKAALLLKFMAYTLSARSTDLQLSRSKTMLSEDDFAKLFPLKPLITEPLVPVGTPWKFNSHAKKPETASFQFSPDLRPSPFEPQPHPSNGSNNWAVTGNKSITGLPLLSNDTHLALSLPAVFYEIQLVSPTQNVYGATLPGAPGVILGFNANLAWGVTNGSSDVLDWYQLRFRDAKKSEYLYDGVWRPVVSRDVTINVRGEPAVHMTLRSSHLGPILDDDSATAVPRYDGLAMRWLALEPSNELKTFLLLDRAKSTSECLQAIQTYNNPDQNFLCADSSDDTGLWHMGQYPIRWPGQGRLVNDGSSSDSDWQGWIDRSELPFSRNPARGFLSSANQAPTDSTYPHDLGSSFDVPYRALRINELLSHQEKFAPADFIQMQTDTVSLPARELLPVLLQVISRDPKLSQEHKDVIELLRNWNYRFDADSAAAPFFQTWLDQLVAVLWTPYFSNSKDYLFPSLDITLQLLLKDPESKWFQPPNRPPQPPGRLARDVLIESTFRTSCDLVSEKLGADSKTWSLARFRPTELAHISHIDGLGSAKFAAGGSRYSIFANQGSHGPVWKLVVALGQKPRAWSMYPGGQSGDPLSASYDNFISSWQKGEMKEVRFLNAADDSDSLKLKTLVLKAAP